MWEQLRRFSALERPAQRFFLRAMVALPLVTLSLRWRGFLATRNTLLLVLSDSGQKCDPVLADKEAALAAHMVNAADRHGFIHPSCLAKSLALWWLLGIRGIESHLRVGIRKQGEKFEAHAWVERDGAAINEPDEHHHHYAAFDTALSALPSDES